MLPSLLLAFVSAIFETYFFFSIHVPFYSLLTWSQEYCKLSFGIFSFLHFFTLTFLLVIIFIFIIHLLQGSDIACFLFYCLHSCSFHSYISLLHFTPTFHSLLISSLQQCLFSFLLLALLHIWTLPVCPFVILFHPLTHYCLLIFTNCILLFFTFTVFRFSNLVSYHSSLTACNIASCLYYCQHFGNFSLLLFFVSVILFHSLICYLELTIFLVLFLIVRILALFQNLAFPFSYLVSVHSSLT